MKQLHYGVATHTGKVRAMNQDTLFAGRLERDDAKAIHFLAVADGIGGYLGGDTASKIAIETSLQFLRNPELLWPAEDAISLWPKLLKQMAAEINDAILLAAKEDPRYTAMGTTLTAVVEINQFLYMLHIGDSRFYHYDEGKLHQISSDHSWAAELLRSGQISPEEARTHPNRNILTQSLGYAGKLLAETKVLELTPYSRLLICSDGLYTLVTDNELQTALKKMKDPSATANELIELANERGGFDNISAITALYLSETRGAQ